MPSASLSVFCRGVAANVVWRAVGAVSDLLDTSAE